MTTKHEKTTTDTKHTTAHAAASSTKTTAQATIAPTVTAEVIAQAMTHADAILALLGDQQTGLTTQARQRSLRFRKGGEPTAALLAGLGTQYAVQIPGVDPAQVQANLQLTQSLQPLDVKLRSVSRVVSDLSMAAKTATWQGTTTLYSALSRASKRNGKLEEELKPAFDFFATKAKNKSGAESSRKSKAGPKAPTTGAKSAPAPGPSASDAAPTPTAGSTPGASPAPAPRPSQS